MGIIMTGNDQSRLDIVSHCAHDRSVFTVPCMGHY